MLDSSQFPDQVLPLEVKFLVVELLLEDPAFLSLYINNYSLELLQGKWKHEKARCFVFCICVGFARLTEKKSYISPLASISSIECINRPCDY